MAVAVKGSLKVDTNFLIVAGLGLAALGWLIWVNFINNDDDNDWFSPNADCPEWLDPEQPPSQYGSGLPAVPGSGESCVYAPTGQLIQCSTPNANQRTYPANLVEAEFSIMGNF